MQTSTKNQMIRFLFTFLVMLTACSGGWAQDSRLREYGIGVGVMSTGRMNAITDVEGVRVGHVTLRENDSIRTGVTAILPHGGNLFQQKVPGAVFVGNGFGKLAGISQVRELGTIETSDDGAVREGAVGAGTGTVCFGYKGGIGTAFRVIPETSEGYTVGVLVQTNFGGVLRINGVAVGRELGKHYMSDRLAQNPDGSCMIVVAADAPPGSRNLERMAKRAMLGLARTGGISSNGSGDYVIAFSVNEKVRVAHQSDRRMLSKKVLRNDAISPLFLAVIEATEEAILNSLFVASTETGKGGRTIRELPEKKVLQILGKHAKTKSGRRH